MESLVTFSYCNVTSERDNLHEDFCLTANNPWTISARSTKFRMKTDSAYITKYCSPIKYFQWLYVKIYKHGDCVELPYYARNVSI
jgi:hypothetical protein